MMRRSLLAILGLWLVGLAACSLPLSRMTSPGTPESPTARIERGLMDATDLPFGWSRRSTGVPQDQMGAIARYRDYQGPPRYAIPFVRAGQIIYLYANETESRAAYKELVAENIPPASANKWPWPPELSFPTHADEITVGCMVWVIDNIPNKACSVIARYGDLVTVVDGQVFEDRWLTMAQFRRLLERVDVRMQTIRQPSANEDRVPTTLPMMKSG
jgi:hypothetical protein